ncbi:MAG: hypothetical protein PVG87_15055, partial [Desulfobacteraceae bacterium]
MISKDHIYDLTTRSDAQMEKTIKISLTVVVLGAIAFFCYSLIAGWYKGNIETAKTQERKAWQQKTETLVEKIEVLEEEITELKGKIIPAEKLAEVFGENPLPVPE